MESLNELQRYIAENDLNECHTMDRLQIESRTISDCCVWASDVPKDDAKRAVEWLKVQRAKDCARGLR